MREPWQGNAPVVEEQKVVQSVEVLPSEPDWELWYRLHPSACQHIKTGYGHCERCGECIDHPACAIATQLEAIRDSPADWHPIQMVSFYRTYVNPWLSPLVQAVYSPWLTILMWLKRED